MQSLEIISVNIWQIVISLCNLAILFFVLKKFLYKPVKKALAAREATLNGQYDRAAAAEAEAGEMKRLWEEKMTGADESAEAIIKEATESAGRRSEAILDEAKEKAGRIVRQAETDAELERSRAEAGMRQEIVDVSALLSEKMLRREINEEDHRELIDSFLSEIGNEDNRQ